VKKMMGALFAMHLMMSHALPAQQDAISRLFPAQPTGFVTDAAQLLDAGKRATLEARLQHLKDVTGAEVAVVTLPTIGDYAPGDVALSIGRTWKVGANAPIGDRRRNAGIVVLLVPRTKEHKGEIFIGTGNGAEGFITDARAGSIADEMIPDLRNSDYAAALDVGTRVIADLVARDLGVQDSALRRPDARPASRNSPNRFKLILYAIIAIIWIISVITRSRGGRGGQGGRGGGLGSSWILPYMIGRSFGGGGGFGGGGFGGGGGGFGGFGGGGGFSGGGGGRSF
jgi:uncharacterized protein